MKTSFLILCLLLTPAAFGQYVGVSVSSEPHPYQAPSHPQHASVQAMAAEQYVLGGTAYTSAQGERPTWELPQAPVPSLGEIARILRKEHAKLKKARVVYEN
ncbi:MAG: hypothetical protein LAO56_07865 [Acidobacteriia bacterium]|jgi:hypothetical protein|nr:hypothetical protein [Terriglobia bacterium]